MKSAVKDFSAPLEQFRLLQFSALPGGLDVQVRHAEDRHALPGSVVVHPCDWTVYAPLPELTRRRGGLVGERLADAEANTRRFKQQR